MENFYLAAIVEEMRPQVTGRTVAKVSLFGADLTLDLRLPDDRVLFATLDQVSPALYLSDKTIKRDPADSQAANPFAALLRKRLNGAKLIALTKDPADRIIRMEFENFDVGGQRQRSTLALAFRGRSTNAYLTDDAGQIEAMLAERGALSVGERLETAGQQIEPTGILRDLGPAATQQEIIQRYFGTASLFGPQLEREFIARCAHRTPLAALQSLVSDLFEKAPTPLVYALVPLEEAGSRLINLKHDLLLSHIELEWAWHLRRYEFASLSEAAESYYQARQEAKAFQNEFHAVRRLLADEVKKRDDLIRAMSADLERFADPERMKRYGDLLLANLAGAQINGSRVRVVDYYDPAQPEIEIDLGESKTLQQAAAKYFAGYQKARRAQQIISSRLAEVSAEVEPLRALLESLEREPTRERIDEIEDKAGKLLRKGGAKAAGRKSRQKGEAAAGRRFRSSDGYEILVGRNDKDNDYISFRVARPQDVWLHAADYPGSHVVIRNPDRNSVPHRTIVEAAELAAFYSQAKQQTKAAVHYTQKKYISKPPKAKPGLVRLTSFKTVMVEPGCNVERID
ncbi:MAG TPA: NFACT family protein [Blastocatellia bacterium]|nr:NFACT family protein [Blastocatellia bacterium]